MEFGNSVWGGAWASPFETITPGDFTAGPDVGSSPPSGLGNPACVHSSLVTGLSIQSLRETEVQPDTEQSPEFESLIPAIRPLLAFGGFVASPILLAVEPSKGREREDKCRLSSSLSSRPGVLKTRSHRRLRVKTDTCVAQVRNWSPEMGGDLPKVSQFVTSRG